MESEKSRTALEATCLRSNVPEMLPPIEVCIACVALTRNPSTIPEMEPPLPEVFPPISAHERWRCVEVALMASDSALRRKYVELRFSMLVDCCSARAHCRCSQCEMARLIDSHGASARL